MKTSVYIINKSQMAKGELKRTSKEFLDMVKDVNRRNCLFL